MGCDYPYGFMKNTAALHGLVAIGIIIANGHAIFVTREKFRFISRFIPKEMSISLEFMFAPVIAVGVYILLMCIVGGAAGSRKKSNDSVYNFKIFYFVVNIMSAFLFSWLATLDIYMLFLINGSTHDALGIAKNIYASFGLMAFELLVSIASIICCCLSGHPGEKPKIESFSMATVTSSAGMNQNFPPPQQGYACDQNYMQAGYTNTGWKHG